MKNSTEDPSGVVETVSFHERLEKMFKMGEAVMGKKDKSKDLPHRDEDGPRAVNFNDDLIRFERALNQAISISGDESRQREFNLKLDRKLEEYRRRKQTAGADPTSTSYQDSLYKLLIANALRIEGVIKLEDAYNNIEEMIGGKKVDPEIFWNAWNVIKAYAEGRPSQIFKGTGLK